MSEEYICPRKISEGRNNPVFQGSGADHWRKESKGYRTCSWDGSLHPDDFMRLVREGAEIEPTDKSYKFYVRAADKHVKGAGKFYTHHLSDEQGGELRSLINSRQVNWGYPGYPYVPLYIPHTVEEKADDSQL